MCPRAPHTNGTNKTKQKNYDFKNRCCCWSQTQVPTFAPPISQKIFFWLLLFSIISHVPLLLLRYELWNSDSIQCCTIHTRSCHSYIHKMNFPFHVRSLEARKWIEKEMEFFLVSPNGKNPKVQRVHAPMEGTICFDWMNISSKYHKIYNSWQMSHDHTIVDTHTHTNGINTRDARRAEQTHTWTSDSNSIRKETEKR